MPLLHEQSVTLGPGKLTDETLLERYMVLLQSMGGEQRS